MCKCTFFAYILNVLYWYKDLAVLKSLFSRKQENIKGQISI